MSSFFAQPYMYWIGVELDTDNPDEITAWHRFYNETHLPEVVAASPGFVQAQRYELVRDPAETGDAPTPSFICVYEIADEAGAKTYSERNDGLAEGRPKYTSGPPVWGKMRPRWRMIWRSFVETGPARDHAPESIFLAGIDPADGESDADLAAFNEFYTGTHLPEVTERGGHARGSRHEVYRAFLHPEPGAPRYLALYEADGPTVIRIPGLTPGPPAWDRADRRWLVSYRKLTI